MLCDFGLPGGDAAATHGKGIPMRQTDTALVTGGDLMAAFGLLTRLPVKVQMEQAVARGARAAWAWPLAGAAVALLVDGDRIGQDSCHQPRPTATREQATPRPA